MGAAGVADTMAEAVGVVDSMVAIPKGAVLKAAVRRRASTAKVDAVVADSTVKVVDAVAAGPAAGAGDELRIAITTDGWQPKSASRFFNCAETQAT